MPDVDPNGPQFPPWAQFRFHTRDLEDWFDGQKRILTRNVDFPPDAPFGDLKRRLEQSAHKRRGRARIWELDADRVGVVLSPPWI
jgi:hypothetical protein